MLKKEVVLCLPDSFHEHIALGFCDGLTALILLEWLRKFISEINFGQKIMQLHPNVWRLTRLCISLFLLENKFLSKVIYILQ